MASLLPRMPLEIMDQDNSMRYQATQRKTASFAVHCREECQIPVLAILISHGSCAFHVTSCSACILCAASPHLSSLLALELQKVHWNCKRCSCREVQNYP